MARKKEEIVETVYKWLGSVKAGKTLGGKYRFGTSFKNMYVHMRYQLKGFKIHTCIDSTQGIFDYSLLVLLTSIGN